MNKIKEIVREYFALMNPSHRYFRITIVVAVVFAVTAAFMNKAEAFGDFEMTSPPIMHTSPAQGISETNLYVEATHPDEYCIALNVYYEARDDNLAGKYAVADVVLNRVDDKRFKNTVCEVIREGVYLESWSTAQHKDLPDDERVYYPKRNKCQFSWFCDGKPDVPDQLAAWREAQMIAYNIVQFDTFRGITEGATHYHATYVAPDWSLLEWRPVYHLIGRIGAHIFYKWV